MVQLTKPLRFICRKRGCNQVATHVTVVRVWAVGRPKTVGTSAQIGLDLGMCEDHALKATPDDLFTDEGWKEIVTAVMAKGFAEPDRASAEVHAKPIGSTQGVPGGRNDKRTQ